MKLLKNFELYELQWSKLLHLGVARRLLEMKKKRYFEEKIFSGFYSV